MFTTTTELVLWVLLGVAGALFSGYSIFKKTNKKVKFDNPPPQEVENTVHVAMCGHETKIKDTLHLFGEEVECGLLFQENGKVEYYHRCIEAMAILCAWCGKPIIIGDPLTLMTPRNKNFKTPEHAVVYSQNPLQLVGCLRWDCCDTGGLRAGFWIPPGKVYRVPSPIEMAMASDDTVIVGNVSDPKEATRKTEEFLKKQGGKES